MNLTPNNQDQTDLKISESTILDLKDHILLAVFEREGLIFNLENRHSHEVNRTGTAILQLLNGERTVKELLRDFTQECGQSEAVVKNDVNIFLRNIIERGWVYVKRD